MSERGQKILILIIVCVIVIGAGLASFKITEFSKENSRRTEAIVYQSGAIYGRLCLLHDVDALNSRDVDEEFDEMINKTYKMRDIALKDIIHDEDIREADAIYGKVMEYISSKSINLSLKK